MKSNLGASCFASVWALDMMKGKNDFLSHQSFSAMTKNNNAETYCMEKCREHGVHPFLGATVSLAITLCQKMAYGSGADYTLARWTLESVASHLGYHPADEKIWPDIVNKFGSYATTYVFKHVTSHYDLFKRHLSVHMVIAMMDYLPKILNTIVSYVESEFPFQDQSVIESALLAAVSASPFNKKLYGSVHGMSPQTMGDNF